MNILFQIVWFLIKPLIPRKKEEHKVADLAGRMLVQLKLARFFGRVAFVFAGDSNAAGFRPKRFMSAFRSIACNIAIEGTTADQWCEFFMSEEGKTVREAMGDAIVVWSIGGNHVIQKKMDIAAGALRTLHDLFPDSYNIVVPTLHYSLLGIVGVTEEEGRVGVAQVNAVIKNLWKQKAIDLVSLIEQISGLPFSLLLRDPVHYGDVARKALIEAIRGVTGVR
jgi:hypothetical protein